MTLALSARKPGPNPNLEADTQGSAEDRRRVGMLFRRHLAARERLILLLHHHERMTPAEIGLVLDLSEAEVRRQQRSLRTRLDVLLRSGREA